MSPGLETLLRLGGTVGIFAIMALWELAAPYRELQASKLDRWTRNLTLVTLSTLAVRLVLPAGAVTVAWVADQRGWGLLRLWPPPPVIAFVGSVVLLDLVIYLQHVVFHRVPALWRLHLVHHSDVDVDVTTGDRFHPLEI
jgi:sterol desaturase/sphingolipid hydroxylase (fatty acid hydroxylase superfamily)